MSRTLSLAVFSGSVVIVKKRKREQRTPRLLKRVGGLGERQPEDLAMKSRFCSPSLP